MHSGPIVIENKYFKVIDCIQCGWAHLDPLPSADAVNQLYKEDDYYTDNAWFDQERKEHMAGLWDTAFSYQAKQLGPAPMTIDWGCGAGWFPMWYQHVIKQNCIGIEPSKRANEYLHYLPIQDRPFILPCLRPTYQRNPANHRMALILEHLIQPVQFLEQLKKRWYKRGLIFVPNEFNVLRRKYAPNSVLDPKHINYFSPQGLRNLVIQCGFKVVWEGATFPMEIFLAMNLNYLENPALGHKLHLARLHFEKTLGHAAFDLYRLLYRKLGWGRGLLMTVELQ